MIFFRFSGKVQKIAFLFLKFSPVPVLRLISTNHLFSNLSRKYCCGTFMERNPNNGGAPLQLFDSKCLDIRIVIN